jgi:hypothetical protein
VVAVRPDIVFGPEAESAERAATARTNRRAALTAADWARRHHEPVENLAEILETLGIERNDLVLRVSTSIVLP